MQLETNLSRHWNPTVLNFDDFGLSHASRNLRHVICTTFNLSMNTAKPLHSVSFRERTLSTADRARPDSLQRCKYSHIFSRCQILSGVAVSPRSPVPTRLPE